MTLYYILDGGFLFLVKTGRKYFNLGFWFQAVARTNFCMTTIYTIITFFKSKNIYLIFNEVLFFRKLRATKFKSSFAAHYS